LKTFLIISSEKSNNKDQKRTENNSKDKDTQWLPLERIKVTKLFTL